MIIKTMTKRLKEYFSLKKRIEELNREILYLDIKEKAQTKHIGKQVEKLDNPRNWMKYIIQYYGPFSDLSVEHPELSEAIVADPFNDFTSVREFLSDIHTVAENKAMQALIKHLIQEQIIFIAKISESELESNYSRATLNGFLKLQEALETQSTEYKKLNAPKEKLTPEETFAVMGD
jgi:hypothetical protein